jgi:hypothetical protein
MAKHSGVLQIENDNPEAPVAAIVSPKGNLTVYVLNKSDANVSLDVAFASVKSPRTLYKYQVTESAITKPNFAMNPLATFEVAGAKPGMEDTVPPLSITVYSTYKLMNEEPGIAAD